MAHDEEVYIRDVLQDLGYRQDKLHATMESSVVVIKNVTVGFTERESSYSDEIF